MPQWQCVAACSAVVARATVLTHPCLPNAALEYPAQRSTLTQFMAPPDVRPQLRSARTAAEPSPRRPASEFGPDKFKGSFKGWTPRGVLIGLPGPPRGYPLPRGPTFWGSIFGLRIFRHLLPEEIPNPNKNAKVAKTPPWDHQGTHKALRGTSPQGGWVFGCAAKNPVTGWVFGCAATLEETLPPVLQNI